MREREREREREVQSQRTKNLASITLGSLSANQLNAMEWRFAGGSIVARF